MIDNSSSSFEQRSGSFITKLKKFHAGIDTAFAFFSAALILLMTVLGTVDIMARRFLNSPLPGVYELMRFMMGGIAFFTFAYVQLRREHISVPFVSERLSRKGAALFDLFCLAIMLIVSACFAWYGWIDAITSWRGGDTTMGTVELPIGPAKMVVPVGCVLLCLRLLSQACESIAKLTESPKNNFSQTKESPS